MKHSFIFQIHNREGTVQELITPFINAQQNGFSSELIICDDGSSDKTLEKIKQLFPHNQKQNIVLYLPDVLEVQLTMTAMKLVTGDIIHWIQDDDYYENMQFAIDAERIFSNCGWIAALSPKHGFGFNEKMEFLYSYGEYKSTDLGCHKSPRYNKDGFVRTQCIDRAPFIFPKWFYDQVGGIDPTYLNGKSNYTEIDLCLRFAKELGKEVGVYKTTGYHYNYWDKGCLRPGSTAMTYSRANRDYCFNKHFIGKK